VTRTPGPRSAGTTLAFDRALVSSTGDLWELGAAAQRAFKLVVVQPGPDDHAVRDDHPDRQSGTVVRGVLYLDHPSALSNYGPSPSGDQLEAIPTPRRSADPAARPY
jgi:hypothetical protein